MQIEDSEPVSVVQTQIDLLIDEVNEYAKENEYFDEWLGFQIVTLAQKLKKKVVFDKL